ncbi:MAG TPA: hypothetical protein VEV13_02615 [Candidatus Limnocylindria bacterium]|nr:hypothetical protein [Candidatus Limnocylindria bacterium]
MSSARAVRESVLPLTRIPVAELAPNVVVVGDPERARAVGERLEGACELASNRECVSIGGTYHGVPVTVVSHGVGGPGAGVAVEMEAAALFVIAGPHGVAAAAAAHDLNGRRPTSDPEHPWLRPPLAPPWPWPCR